MSLKISEAQYFNWQSRLAKGGAFKFFANLFGVYGVLFYALAGLYLFTQPHGWKVAVLAAVAALFTRYIVCELFDHFYPKAHPYQRLNFKVPVAWILFSSMDKRHDAFPSEHASCAAAISLVLYLFFPVLGLWGFIVCAVMSAARVIIGYHDIYDIAGGWLAGLASAAIIMVSLSPIIIK